MFAAELESRGFARATLQSALAAHPAEMTRYLAVARSLPRWLVQAIGPAPRAGRPRWMAMAEFAAADSALDAVAGLVEMADFRAASSDARFSMAHAALQQAVAGAGSPLSSAPTERDTLSFIHIEELDEGTRFTILKTAPAGLSAYLFGRLGELVAAFQSEPAATRPPT
jgi:ParB family transcriptional regulator, chromosome partitioning protein